MTQVQFCLGSYINAHLLLLFLEEGYESIWRASLLLFCCLQINCSNRTWQRSLNHNMIEMKHRCAGCDQYQMCFLARKFMRAKNETTTKKNIENCGIEVKWWSAHRTSSSFLFISFFSSSSFLFNSFFASSSALFFSFSSSFFRRSSSLRELLNYYVKGNRSDDTLLDENQFL